MSVNNNVTQMLFNHVRKNFTYKTISETSGTNIALNSYTVNNYAIDWSNSGILKGDRIVINDGTNTFISYASEDAINSLRLEDKSKYDFNDASITIYFIPKLFKEYVPEQINLPYGVFTYISRMDEVLQPNDRLYNYEFQLNLYDDNPDDTEIENTKDDYIRIFDRMHMQSYNNFYWVHSKLIQDLGVEINDDYSNSTMILENIITFNLIIKEA